MSGQLQRVLPHRIAAGIAAWIVGMTLTGCAQPEQAAGNQPATPPAPGLAVEQRADPRIAQRYPGKPRPVARQVLVDGRTVHAVVMPGGPIRLIFIHGTPGSWDNWARYLADPKLRARATMIAMDRPGFGLSGSGRMLPALADQARLLAPLLTLEGTGSGKAYLVGHSLGGPIAAKLAMDYPDQVAGALMIAPSIAPDLEHPRWFNHLADTWLAQALSGTWVQHQFADDDLYNSNAEIMPLARELQAIEPGWARLTMPLVVMQGLKDTLVDPRTADYAERVLPRPNGQVIRLPENDHFLIWSDYPRVTRAIHDLIDQGEAAAAKP